MSVAQHESAERWGAASHAEARAELAEATASVFESLDYWSTISRIAHVAVPRLADWCMLDLCNDDGEVQRVEVAYADPDAAQLIEAVKNFHVPQTLASEAPALLEPLPHALFPVQAAIRSAMSIPLVARGRSMGALILALSHSRRPKYDADDLAVVAELSKRCAIAIDNARLYGEARQAIRMWDDFLYLASHELRTPLASLELALENLGRRVQQVGLDDAVCEWIGSRLATARRQSKRLQHLANDLLDVSRITGDRLRLSLEPVVLTQVVKDVLARLEEQGEVSRANCEIDLRSSGEAIGHWDRLRVQQIVTKLLENALKFGAGAPVEISVTADGELAELTVRDHGIGIATSDRHRIFSRFERAVPDRRYGGFGLGLWIVRQLVGAMRGTIHVESELGQGAAFIVRLPKHEASGARDERAGTTSAGHSF